MCARSRGKKRLRSRKRTASGGPSDEEKRSSTVRAGARRGARLSRGHGGCNVTAVPRDLRGQLHRLRIGGHVALGVARPPPRAPARCPLVQRSPPRLVRSHMRSTVSAVRCGFFACASHGRSVLEIGEIEIKKKNKKRGRKKEKRKNAAIERDENVRSSKRA